MPNISHFLITRFNLRPNDSLEGGQLNEEWLRYRLDLFDKFCFPTVKNQSEQDFKWLVLFDTETPDSIKQRIRQYQQDWSNFVPVFLPPGVQKGGYRAVMEQLTAMPDILITTRLDNDDGLCRTFVEQIRKHATATEPTVLEFPVGFVWHKKRIYLDRQKHNPFTTLVEPCNPSKENTFRTIYSGSHLDIENLGRVLIVTEEPSWIQVIHGNNVANKARGIRYSAKDVSKHFDIRGDQINMNENSVEYSLDKARSIVREWIYAAVGFCKRCLGLVKA